MENIIGLISCLICAFFIFIVTYPNKYSHDPIPFWSGDTKIKDKVKNVVVSQRLVESPCVLTTDNWGWSANMERIMKSQVLGDTQMRQFMTSSKTMEINVEHPIMKEIEKRIEKEAVDCLNDMITLLYEGALLSSGFSLDKPQEFVNKLNKMIQAGLIMDESEEDSADEHKEINHLDESMENVD